MRRFALGCALLLAVSACTGGTASTSVSRTNTVAVPVGGTLRVALPYDPPQQLDPQKEFDGNVWELFRCCLLRTLLSYNGLSAAEGGALPRPDLAIDEPAVSSDGFSWTFHIRPGVHYAPPFQATEITAGDFVRAIERTLRVRVEGPNAPGTYGTTGFYFDVIDGARQYTDGESESVSGLETPDDHTLIVHLTQPTGDLDYRFALLTTAPIPPSPTDPEAPFGVATGHDEDYGRFLVGSGPYMVEGSGALDFTVPAPEQRPVTGYVPGSSIVFVRNPFWDESTDPLRAAYADRIEFTILPTVPTTRDQVERSAAKVARAIDAGSIDVALGYPPQRAQLDRYRADATLQGRIYTTTGGTVYYLAMNLAVPPFDDVHVRRAVNLAIDKSRLRSTLEGVGGPLFWEPTYTMATHIAPDSEEGGLLSSFDPYQTPGNRGDIELAREQMARSRYDGDGDGLCDAAVCRNVSSAGLACGGAPLPSIYPEGLVIRRDLSRIGIHFAADPRSCPPDISTPAFDPTAHVPITSDHWGPDYPDAAQFLQQLFSLTSEDASPIAMLTDYFTMVGASSSQLRRWGYSVDRVSSVDDQIALCAGLSFGARINCWARLDRYLMTQVVPWVPFMEEMETYVVSSRVAAFSVDQSLSLPAFDRIALAAGSS